MAIKLTQITKSTPAADVAGGAKPLEVECLAKPTACVMALVTGRGTSAAWDLGAALDNITT